VVTVIGGISSCDIYVLCFIGTRRVVISISEIFSQRIRKNYTRIISKVLVENFSVVSVK